MGLVDTPRMPRYTIVTMPGDGIANQVPPEALRVLGAVGLGAEYVHAGIGSERWINEGNALPERTVELQSSGC
jgi:isocitrate/isopropylmalate dehydrogenase